MAPTTSMLRKKSSIGCLSSFITSFLSALLSLSLSLPILVIFCCATFAAAYPSDSTKSASAKDTAHKVLGIIGNFFSFGLYISPVKMYWDIVKKEVGRYAHVPCITTLFNNAIYLVYTSRYVQPGGNNTWIVTINAVGVAIESIYVIIFLCFSSRRIQAEILGGLAAILVILAGITGLLAFTHRFERRVLITGIFCVISGLVMYASTLPSMIEVYRDKSVESVQLPLLFAGLINTTIWLIYAGLHLDIYILVQNSVGLFLNLVQILIYYYYSCSSPPPA